MPAARASTPNDAPKATIAGISGMMALMPSL